MNNIAAIFSSSKAHLRWYIESITNRRRRRAFTITEILIAATLSLVFASLVAQVLATGVRNTGDTLARMEADTRSREVFRTVTASLRGAQPLGNCLDPKGATDINDCLLVGPAANSTAVVLAKPDEIVFNAYTNKSGEGIRKSPDRLRVWYDKDSGLVTVSRWASPAGSSYIAPPSEWLSGTVIPAATPGKQRLGQLSKSATPLSNCGNAFEIFRYYDAQGVELTPAAGNCQVSNLSNIALVTVNAKVSYRDQNTSSGTSTVSLTAAVSLQSSAYARTEAVR
jgi:hypothetical protein